MERRLLAVVLLITASFSCVAGNLDCRNEPDGTKQYTCTSYVVCRNGMKIEISCADGTLYDPDRDACTDTTDYSCDVQDCSNKNNGRYMEASQKECRLYYTCHLGNYVGHNWCPHGLIFDSVDGNCDWPYNVAPPCGTAPAFGWIYNLLTNVIGK